MALRTAAGSVLVLALHWRPDVLQRGGSSANIPGLTWPRVRQRTARSWVQKVQLNGLGDEKLAKLCPHALVAADGSFQLTTFKTGDGAPLGTYALHHPLAAPRLSPVMRKVQTGFAVASPIRAQPVREVQIHLGDNDLGSPRLKVRLRSSLLETT